MQLEKVANGEISVERFFGQTVVYFPAEIGDKVGEFFFLKSAMELFSKERLAKTRYEFFSGSHEGVDFCQVNLPPVLTFDNGPSPDVALPNRFVDKIMKEYRRLS